MSNLSAILLPQPDQKLHTEMLWWGIEMVHRQADSLHVRRMLINKFLDKICPILLC